MENWFVSAKLQGIEARGTILRLDRYLVCFEIYESAVPLRISEALPEFRVFIENEVVYSGRAVISNLLFTGAAYACEVRLDEPGIQKRGVPANGDYGCRAAYDQFFAQWQKQLRLPPEFKLAVVDLQTYLADLKLLCEEAEVTILGNPAASRADVEQHIASSLSTSVLESIQAFHDRFEDAANQVPDELESACQSLVRRQLHPYFLAAPFGYRTYQKPLGYAGDYEIMNMIHRNTFEGGSLFAKLLHFWLVSQWAAKSVRNRVTHMKTRILEETLRVSIQNRRARILSLGCGPAREVADFMQESPLSDFAEFNLVDFDAEALDYANRSLQEAKRSYSRQTTFQVTRLSVNQVLKFAAQPLRSPMGTGYDVIYCGGLFDYFSDRVCRQLVDMFYQWTSPGGLVVAANMNDREKPFRKMVEHLLDWHLLYREARCMASFVPSEAADSAWTVVQEPVMTNLFLEVRKPPKKA